ncbi:methylmalonyl-CoA mutase subunit beta [Gracilimonas sp.]|uniref:methylmalonyl-CoA mutase subunit beta n=1 Tax=Gracilimonas sp. TaxID=1974203 RepID=UPI002871101B|nr:methylmalonyl-CoA mutase subunit beta [Gracilimonas sp.]
MDTLNFKNELSFDEFPPISTDEWEAVIEKDLKGKDYKETLSWNPENELEVLPFYRREHLEELSRSPKPVRASTGWTILQPILVKDVDSANKTALNALQNGASGLYFYGDSDAITSHADVEQLFKDIQLEIICVKLSNSLSLSNQLLNGLTKLIDSRNLAPDDLNLSVTRDPFSKGSFSGELLDREMIEQNISGLPFTLHIDLSGYGNAGASIIQQTAFALSAGNELLGILGKDVTFNFNFAVTNNYFPEIAKLRAFRLMWNQVLESYESKATDFSIHTETALWNKAQNDAHNNMLRATTEAMSAILGGTDALTVFPFDQHFSEPSEFSNRISRNVQLILQEEAYFDKVADPGAGSYYIETLTDKIAKKSWALFQSIEEKGGFYECLKSGFIQDEIQESRNRKIEAYKEKKETLVGVNKYQPEEKISNSKFQIPNFSSVKLEGETTEIKKIEPLNMEVELRKGDA